MDKNCHHNFFFVNDIICSYFILRLCEIYNDERINGSFIIRMESFLTSKIEEKKVVSHNFFRLYATRTAATMENENKGSEKKIWKWSVNLTMNILVNYLKCILHSNAE